MRLGSVPHCGKSTPPARGTTCEETSEDAADIFYDDKS